MTAFSKQAFLKYFLELLVVAFGVFLGLIASNWNADRKMKVEVDRTKTFIIEEIETNIESLAFAIRYHEQLAVKLDSVLANLDEDIYLKPFFKNKQFKLGKSIGWTGPGVVTLQRSIFESGKIAGILQELDIKTIQLITTSYEWQANYKMMVEKLLNKLFEIDSSTKVADVIGIVEMISNDLLMNEKRTKEHLEWTLSELAKK